MISLKKVGGGGGYRRTPQVLTSDKRALLSSPKRTGLLDTNVVSLISMGDPHGPLLGRTTSKLGDTNGGVRNIYLEIS